VNHFAEQFLGPVGEECQEGAEEGDLRYYEDGTRRTLTDEQIAIFRHSEIQALLRDRRHAAEAKEEEEEDSQAQNDISKEQRVREEDGNTLGNTVEEPEQREEVLEDGELSSSPPVIKNKQSTSKKEDRAQKVKQKSFFKQYIKPDLRKRTWDKVDTGLGSLDYDEGESSAVSTRPTQRRRISYNDE
jgi:hypothetical protein